MDKLNPFVCLIRVSEWQRIINASCQLKPIIFSLLQFYHLKSRETSTWGPQERAWPCYEPKHKNDDSEGLSKRPMHRPSLNCLVQQPVLHQSLQPEVIMNSPQWLSRKCCVCNKTCKWLDILVFSDKNKKTLHGPMLPLIWLLWD